MALTIISLLPLTKKNNGLLCVRCLGGMADLGHEVFVLDGGEDAIEQIAFDHQGQHNGHFHVLERNEKNQKKLLSKADIVLLPSAPDMALMKRIASSGVIPVLPQGAIKGIENYSAIEETGNAFTFPSPDFWPFISTLIRAVETSTFEYDWGRIKKKIKKWAA